MPKTRDQIIAELQRRDKEATAGTTEKECLEHWLKAVNQWTDYTANDFVNALSDAEYSNKLYLGCGDEKDPQRQDSLKLIGELKQFLSSDEVTNAPEVYGIDECGGLYDLEPIQAIKPSEY